MENQQNQIEKKPVTPIDERALKRDLAQMQLDAYCTYRVCKAMGLHRFATWGSNRPVFYRSMEEIKEIAARLT